MDLGSFSSDPPGELDVLGHDGDTLGVDGAQVGVLEQADQVALASFLQGHDRGALESEISLEVLGNLSHQTLERQLSDQELSRFLVSSDFPQSHGSRSVSVGFFDSTSGGCALPCCLGGQLLPGSFSSGRLSGSLLCPCHLES